jgi:hypothetical protein
MVYIPEIPFDYNDVIHRVLQLDNESPLVQALVMYALETTPLQDY